MLRAHQLRLSTDVRRLLGRVTELLARMLMVLFVAHPLQVLADPELQFVPPPRLGDPPTAPPFAAQLFPESRIEAPPADGFVVDAQDREAVRVFYRGMYSLSEDVPMQWTGSYATGVAGTTAQLFQNATALRINWYRAMAGVPWSFSYPGANFSQATVTMNPGGPVSVEPVATGFGENTIVWLPQGMTSNTPWPRRLRP